MNRRILFIILLLMLVLSGCAGYSKKEIEEIATQSAMGTPPPHDLQTMAAVHLALTLTPTPTITPIPTITPYPGTPTMSAQEWMATQYAAERSLAMTQKADELAFERQKISATERAISAKEAQRVLDEQNKIIYANQTAQAQQTQAYATSFAAATATQAHGLVIAVNNTAAAQATQAVEPTHFAWTQTAVSIDVRISEGQARGVELATERQELKNTADALLPWILVIVSIIVLGNSITKWVKVRPFKRDEFGREQTLYIQNGPITQVVKPELMSSPVMRLTDEGAVDMPVLSEVKEQSDVTRRAQLVEAIVAMPDAQAPQAPKMLSAEYGGGNNQGVPRIRLRGDQALGGVMDEADSMLVEE